jgi:hypothetical protein
MGTIDNDAMKIKAKTLKLTCLPIYQSSYSTRFITLSDYDMAKVILEKSGSVNFVLKTHFSI